MSTKVDVGDAIEGKKVEGHSRKPLKYLGLFPQNGVMCHRFSAKFDVKAEITEPVREEDGTRRIDPRASIDPADTIVARDAFVHSLERRHQDDLAPGSARHQATFWRFPKQTAVRVSLAHQEIQNARDKAKRQTLPT